ncbi:hypothetical protein LTR10_000165 [Elasticomyces elasticus]|nr:hypothetical protein LTR10_000165 [Elasticomyces elasticus]KAK4980577.1 hypothetical protein LTR42_000885 [Elasticomyces elasticus]
MRKVWRPEVPGTCINLVHFYYGLQIPNIITDIWIVISPIRELTRMELTRKIKTGAIAMFLLGTVTVAFDIVRLVVLLDIGHIGPDLTYHLTDAAIWTTIEPTVAIVAICIPSVRNLTRSREPQGTDGRSESGSSAIQLTSNLSK